jgi:glycosyltransferase involved in cell wall biosynthesis
VLTLDPGGTERLVVELVNRLQHEIPMVVCCLDRAGAWAENLAGAVPVRVLHRTSGFRPMLGRALAQIARAHGCNVIHGHQYTPFVYSCLARAWLPRLCVVFTEHGRLTDAPPSAKRRLANRILRTLPRRVFTVSNELRQHLVAEGFSATDVDVIYNGVTLGAPASAATRRHVRQQFGVSDNTLVLATVARLDPVKDIATLLLAVAQISKELPVMLVVVGDGPERTRLERLREDLDLSESVRFVGHREDARQWIAGCDVYVNCSISEGISLTILEAMAAAVPVVATDVGGTREIVDNNSGRLVPDRDPAALACAICALAKRPAVRDALGEAARERVRARFTLDRMIDEYRQVYLRSA